MVYAPSDPADARLQFIPSPRILIEAIIWIGLISAGLWGVRRNLGSDSPGGGVNIAARPERPAPPAPRAPVPSTGRRQFGQRTTL